MVGLRINVKNQRQFNLLRILTLSLSIVLDEEGINTVKNLYNTVFDEYFIDIVDTSDTINSKSSKVWGAETDIFKLMEKYILKGNLPMTLGEMWEYYIFKDCMLYANNYENGTYEDAFSRKLDMRFHSLELSLLSDARNMIRTEALEIEKVLQQDGIDLEFYWYTPNSDACEECKRRDGVRIKDIENLSIHNNCKCSIIIK